MKPLLWTSLTARRFVFSMAAAGLLTPSVFGGGPLPKKGSAHPSRGASTGTSPGTTAKSTPIQTRVPGVVQPTTRGSTGTVTPGQNNGHGGSTARNNSHKSRGNGSTVPPQMQRQGAVAQPHPAEPLVNRHGHGPESG